MKKVLITGSSRGIGCAIARDLNRAGYDCILHGKSESSALVEISRELNAKYLTFDVSDTKECKEVLENFSQENPDLYAVILNAGIARDATFAALEEDDWKNIINTNLNSFYNVLKPLILPLARARRGRIIVMSSVSGVVGNRGQSNYSASKAGLIGAAKSLALELASRNICVNVVAPGCIKTEMTQSLAFESEIKKAIPMRRFGESSEVAPLVRFLLSDEASYITRQVIGVNGGLI